MIPDPLSPSLSLHAAHGLVDSLRGALAGATCPQWVGSRETPTAADTAR